MNWVWLFIGPMRQWFFGIAEQYLLAPYGRAGDKIFGLEKKVATFISAMPRLTFMEMIW